MKIKWTDEKRETAVSGVLETGQAYDLPDEIAEAFIRQGQAVKVKKEKK